MRALGRRAEQQNDSSVSMIFDIETRMCASIEPANIFLTHG